MTHEKKHTNIWVWDTIRFHWRMRMSEIRQADAAYWVKRIEDEYIEYGWPQKPFIRAQIKSPKPVFPW